MWPNLEVIGWYSAKSEEAKGVDNDKPTAHDVSILKGDMLEFCENPLLLIMNT